MDAWRLSAVDAVRLQEAGELSSVELIESVLERIEQHNEDLNAIVALDAGGALVAAAEADRRRAAGDQLGPLHGVPVTIKANLDVEGQPTTSGVAAFADKVAPADAPSVGHLRRAGAIVIGRTNMPEFGFRGATESSLYGTTRNPWHPVASPGGSSGGASAAAAMGFGPLHQGSDIGGSLRFPAGGCGLATVKPTSCRVPANNLTSSGERGLLSQLMSVQGIITRHVADARVATKVMAQPSPRDPNCPPVPWDGPPIPTPITIAVSDDWGIHEPHPGLVDLHRRAADQLSDAGYQVIEADPPPIEDAYRGWFSLATTEAAIGMTPAVHRFGGESIRTVFDWTIEMGGVLGRDDYVAGLGARTAMMRAWDQFLDEHPLVLTPFLTMPMYDVDFDTQSPESMVGVAERAMHAFGINFLGLPAGVIGMDLVEDKPSGVQIVGRRYREDLICDALEAIEQRNGVMSHRLWERESA
ncbi:MAG: amidase [Actinomycetota bacterium]